MKRPMRLKKERWVFSFWEGFEMPIEQISSQRQLRPPLQCFLFQDVVFGVTEDTGLVLV
jgi:hypothetical protein